MLLKEIQEPLRHSIDCEAPDAGWRAYVEAVAADLYLNGTNRCREEEVIRILTGRVSFRKKLYRSHQLAEELGIADSQSSKARSDNLKACGALEELHVRVVRWQRSPSWWTRVAA